MNAIGMFMSWWTLGAFGVLLALALVLSVLFRTVVPTNMVHIVQRRKQTTPYGIGQQAGNVYFDWPGWVPFIGVAVIELPVSNFDLPLEAYEAYDKERVPFVVDVVAFYLIDNPVIASQRVPSFPELKEQLQLISRGAVRTVLAEADIHEIMLQRATFGTKFTASVEEQLKEWGVRAVKSMELMDIRDGHDSHVVRAIMAQKTSHIEMQSRIEVANNGREAENAEIVARRDVDLQRQQAAQQVGERTAMKEQAVGIANEQARQEVLTQEKETRTRHMAVLQVEQVRQAEITKQEQVVAAEQQAQTTIIVAQGHLEAEQRNAQGIQVVGEARAAAEKAMQLAPVMAAIELANKIGENPGYQQYLIAIEAVKAYLSVAGEQAKALQGADVKVIANTGKATDGMGSVMDLFTSQGGLNIASMIESLSQAPMGKQLIDKVLAIGTTSAPAPNGAMAQLPASE